MAGIFDAKLRVAAKTISPGTSGDATYTENVAILPANAYVVAMFGRVKTAFVGLTAPKVSLGVSGDVDRYMVAQPIGAVNELITNNSGALGGSAVFGAKGFCAAMNKELVSTTAKPVIATFTSSSATFDPTSGEVEFVIVYVDVNSY